MVNAWRRKHQTKYEKNTESMDVYLQQVAKFVFNVRNLLSSDVSTLQTDTDKQW